MCSQAGCIQSSQPGAVDDRRREAVVVGVRVGADDEAHVLEPEADLGERELELALAVLGRHPGVEEDDPVAGADRERVHVRHPGPGKRQAQAPNAGQHALAPAELALSPRLAHRGAHARTRRADRGYDRRVPGDPAANAALINRFYEAFARQDGEAMAACYAPDAHFSRSGLPGPQRRRGRGDVADAVRRGHRPRRSSTRTSTPTATRGSAHWEADYTFSHRAARSTT